MDIEEIDILIAKAEDLFRRKLGIVRDPRVDAIFRELAKAGIERKQQYNWPMDQLYCAVTEVAAERIAKLEKELAKLKGEPKP